MIRKEIENSREYQISKAAVESYNNNVEDNDYISGFETGAEWADANPVHYDGKAYIYVLNKGVEQGRREMLDEMCEWLDKNIPVSDLENEHYIVFTEENKRNFIESFRKDIKQRLMK